MEQGTEPGYSSTPRQREAKKEQKEQDSVVPSFSGGPALQTPQKARNNEPSGGRSQTDDRDEPAASAPKRSRLTAYACR